MSSITRCGECEGCLRDDCRQCVECLRKKKYGGDGSSKQACVLRKCLNYVRKRNRSNKSTTTTTTTPAKNNLSTSLSDNNNNNHNESNSSTSGNKRPRRQPSRSPQSNNQSINGSGSSPSSSSPETKQKQMEDDLNRRYHASLKSLIQVPDDTQMTFRDENNNDNLELSSSKLSTSLTAADQQQQQQQAHPTKPPNHFAGRVVPSKQYNVCGTCGLDENVDTIILCDHPSCNQEFHLMCCRPSLQQVPKGEYYCFDCNPTGSTSLLTIIYQ